MDKTQDTFLNDFLKEFDEKEQKKILLNKEEQIIAARKNAQLEPIRSFLSKFVKMGIVVNHKLKYDNSVIDRSVSNEPQKFMFYDGDSSPSWAPGISIFFDHPAEVEIAIPNKQEEQGVFVVRVSSFHPEAYILEQKYYNMESVCQALSKFLGKNTLYITNDPRKKRDHRQFPSDVPDSPPSD